LLLLVLAAGGVGAGRYFAKVPPPGAGDASVASVAAVDNLPLHRPARCKGYVALSFDDGPTRESDRLLALLRFYGVGALFFNTGIHSRSLPGVVAQEQATPAVQIGNHSYDHPDLNLLTASEIRGQLARTQAIQGASVTFFRPPYGAANRSVQAQLTSLGLLEVLWTKDSKDFAARSAEQVAVQSSGMTNGGILLLHDGHPLTVSAVPLILQHYYARGLCIGKVVRAQRAQTPVESPGLPFYARAVAP
jgi:peptidoglycan/xylan/chitin deacetylase (PgdA/CDA1 family)